VQDFFYLFLGAGISVSPGGVGVRAVGGRLLFCRPAPSIMYIINVWCSQKRITIKANKIKYNHAFKFISPLHNIAAYVTNK